MWKVDSGGVKLLGTASSTKPSASTELTGGAGFTFEDMVVAYYLAALLRREHAAGQEGIVTSVAVQQAGHGHPMDDVIVEFIHDDSRRRLSLQVKRRVTISAAASNTDFRQIIAASVATRATPDFQSNIDAYGFAVEYVGTNRFRALDRLINWARSSPTGEDFTSRFDCTSSAAGAERSLREELLTLIQPKSSDDEVDFYHQFAALKLDGLMGSGALRTEIMNRLQELVVRYEDNLGFLLFDRLCRIAREGAGTGRTWTRQSLLSQLHGQVRLKVIPRYKADINLLHDFSLAGLADVSDEIEGFRVERPAVEKKVSDRLNECRLVNISGLPGCGKSAMLKRIATEYAAKGPILFLKSDRLTGTSWLTFANKLGLQIYDITELLAEIASAGTPILFIDGIDRVRPDQKGIITDILRAIEADEHLSNWKVLASSRDQGLEAYRAWFPGTFYSGTGIGDVTINSFSDSEAEALAKEKPNLRRLLWGSASVREIARRPFFAAVLARTFSDHAATPKTEVDLINAWWERGGHDAPEDTALERQRALVDLADKGVRTLGKNVSVQNLRDSTITQIAALKSDCVIREHEVGAFYSFTHDIFFEWVFFRLLIERGSDWHCSLIDAGEPPLLGRVVGLLAQHAIRSPGKWSDAYRDLETRSLRPQWRRDWLTAPPFTPAFAQVQDEFQALVSENDFTLLEKLLVWFQAQHTVPSPLILKHGSNLVEGVDRVQMADMLGWPSDFHGWVRLLDWLLPLAPSLPSRLLPKVVEVFDVWQNRFASVKNDLSAEILDVCGNLLIELEGLYQTERITVLEERWDGLGRKARSSLATSLRIIILKSASAYPEYATSIFERAIASERIRSEAYSDLMNYTSIMTTVAPELVVALAKAELMEELPQERIDRLKREEQEYIDTINVIRAIPEQERTADQQRALEHVHFPLGYGQIGLDDVGINDHHGYYYPVSALCEPFTSLFAKNSDIALQLVRDLANRATKGWRQVHEINRDRMGTPVPVVLEFPWGKQEFWGDWHVYSWFLGELTSNPLACAFLALSHWAFKQIEDGRPTDEIIREIVKGNECYAVLGLSLVLALKTHHVSETTLPLVTCQRLWRHDIARFAQEPTRDIDLFGFGSMTQLTGEQAKAKEYLDTRPSRKRNVRDLVIRFAIGPDENLRHRFKNALARFPDDLPHELEETRSDHQFTESLKEVAERHAGLGDIANYSKHKTGDEKIFVSYQPPVPLTSEQNQELDRNTTYLQEIAITGGAMQSLIDNTLVDEFKFDDAVNLAQARDNPSMFIERHDIGNQATQDMIAAIAACVIRFGDPFSQDHDWALDVLDRIEHMKERSDTFYESKITCHPTIFLVTGLRRLRESDPSNIELARRMMRLTAYPLKEIGDMAFAALFRDPDPRVAWITAQLALDLAISHRPEIKADGRRDDHANQKAHRKSLKRALGALGTNTISQLTPMPQVWAKSTGRPSRRRSWDPFQSDDVVWDDPDPMFNARYAASVFQHFPIEALCQTDTFKPLVAIALKHFVRWTSERLMPSWKDRQSQLDRISAELTEWTRLLGDLLARSAPHFETELVTKEFLAPFLTDDKNGLSVLAHFADNTVCRNVLDAPTIPQNTFVLLDVGVERLIRDQVFDTDGYDTGEIYGFDLPRLIKALLFVAVEKADGASRFANNDWSEIKLVMPIVTRLVSAVGWSPYVMDQFLTLCERARDSYPLDDFTTQVNAALKSIEKARGGWAGTTLSARIAGVVQCLADTNFPLQEEQAKDILRILDALIDLGDRRSVALEQTEAFRGVQRSLIQ